MRTPRTLRTISVLACAGLIVGAFVAAPAEAKKKKKKKAPACATFTPGAEQGQGKPVVKVTDANTEEAPLLQKVTVAESVADADLLGTGLLSPGTDAFNIQVDSAAAEGGLYVLMEFPERRDYDLNLLHADGSYAARSRSFQPVLGTPGELISEPGHGGEGTTTSEKLVGIRTPDCDGWTLEVQNWFGEGGEFELKVWLGEIKTDPQAPGTETP